ncbi:MAG: pyridoxamine 5'-phosphate oxidase family protein [Acidimicrobiales bacterium]
MASLDDIRRVAALDHGLASLSTVRADGHVQSIVVNAGIIDHPLSAEPVAAFVGRPGTRKLTHLRRRPYATLLWRAGWAWVAAEGSAELIGPDDPLEGFDENDLPALLRLIHSSAGSGHEDDWVEFDRTVAAERRVAVLLTPERIYVNP